MFVCQVLEHMRIAGCPPDAETLLVAARACAVVGEWRGAHQIWAVLSQPGHPAHAAACAQHLFFEASRTAWATGWAGLPFMGPGSMRMP